MLRLNPSSVSPYHQPRTNGVTTASWENNVSPTILKEVVESVILLGVEKVYSLCQQKIEGRIDYQAIGCLMNEKKANLHWLALSSTNIVEIQNTVAALTNKSNDVVAVFKEGADRNHEIILFSSELGSANPYQVIARAGAIYLQTRNDIKIIKEIQLMSFAQYLSYGRPAWQEWDLSWLNLSGMNLSGVNLRAAKLLGTNLNETDLSWSSLDRVNLGSTVLQKTNLANATITNVCFYCDSINIDGDTNFENATITLSISDFDEWSAADLLRLINTINNEFMDLKISLLHQVLDLLTEHNVPFSSYLNSHLLFNFFNNDSYLQDAKICLFTKKNLIDTPTEHWLSTIINEGIGELRSKEGIGEIKTILEYMKKKLPDIFAAFKFGADRQKEIILLTSHYPKSNRRYQLIAKAGAICLKAEGSDKVVQLISFVQLLNQAYLYNSSSGSVWDLSDMDLSNLDLSEMDLEECYLLNSDLSNANLTNANLCEAKLENANLSGANLTSANLCGANLENANLSGANLTNANLCEANLEDTNLCGTNLTLANMWSTFIGGSKLNSATCFHRASIKITFDTDEVTYDQILDHITNEEKGSYLTLIDGIDENCVTPEGKVLKLDLMHQVIRFVSREPGDYGAILDGNILDSAQAVLDIFMNNPLYINDPIIVAFIEEHILSGRITEGNTAELTYSGAPELQLLLKVVNSSEQPAQFMLDNNGFFIQLMMLCTDKGMDAHIQQQAQQLYQRYLNLEQLSAAKYLIDEVLMSDARLIDGLDKEEKTGDELPAGPCFAFVKKQENTNQQNANSNINHTLILDRTQLRAMLRLDSSDVDCKWDAMCYARGETHENILPVAPEEQNLPQIISLFPLFSNAYHFKLNNATFTQLLTTINLNYSNTNNDANLLSKDYTPLFLEALATSQATTKLCDAQDQMTLTAIFSPLLLPYPLQVKTYLEAVKITDSHFAQLIGVYDLSQSSHLTRAQTLFCLAAVFAKYSSSYLFGQENQSPQALRAYAAALLAKAYEIDSSVFASKENTPEFNFTNWMQMLLGGKDTTGNAIFTCTAVLSSEMLRHAGMSPDFSDIIAKIKPPAW